MMKTCCALTARRWRSSFLLSLLAAATGWLFLGVSDAPATNPVQVVRIEEDWRLVVATPEVSSNSPQVVCAMSPSGGDDGDYMAFELNHQSQPGYATGGLHLHAWEGEHLLGSAHTQTGVSMNHSQEQVEWTQSMTLANGLLTYEVSQGTSDTWGAFGTGELRASAQTTLTNLNSYNVEATVAGSGVGFGANRVSSLSLKTVRLVLSTGEVLEVAVNRDILSNSQQ
jgi:hypothetical protein